MNPNSIERVLATVHSFYAKFSEEWQRGANKRTILILVVGGFIFVSVYSAWIAPPSDFPTGELVTIPEGVALDEAGRLLKEQNAVRSSIALRLIVTMLGSDRTIRAGDYLFKEPPSVFKVARAISRGEYGLEPTRVRVPEGATTREMARIFSTRLKRIDEEDFLERALPFEGYLFPDTYFFLPNATADTVIQTLRQNFDAQIVEIAGEIEESGRSLEEIVIMASILEREARIMRDRQMIAGVLLNRLEADMPLQVDAVFLYTLGKGTFQLTTADLKSDSPYNTYRHKGLPPTPIGSPGLSSLRAAVTPVEHNYIFFLADRSGVTHFSATYEEHLRLKARYLGT